MKKLLFLFFTIFAVVLPKGGIYADTVNIDWMVDNSIYDTTTCTVGGDIILPTAPTKRGHTFLGWATSYTPIEYIQSTGTQYINAYVKTAINQRVEYDVQLNHMVSNGKTQILGSGGATDGVLYSFRFISGQSNILVYQPGVAIDTGVQQDTNRHYMILDNLNQVVTVDGHTHHMPTSSLSGETPEQYLFAYSSMGTPNLSYGFIGKMYAAKFYNNDVLVRNFIPVLDPDGTPCMYDKVSKTFFYNAGTGDFVAGPVIGG